jgi:hypothetical protein
MTEGERCVWAAAYVYKRHVEKRSACESVEAAAFTVLELRAERETAIKWEPKGDSMLADILGAG